MKRELAKLARNALAVARAPKPQTVNLIPTRKPPASFVAMFEGFKPPYQYNNGIHSAYFVKMVFWKEAGKFCSQWVAMYQTEMAGGGSFWTERYFWGFANGQFEELKQHGVLGVRKRMLRG